jgi:hypothetical protein
MPLLGLPSVKGAAFSTARYKIKEEYFKDISKLVQRYIRENVLSHWKGYRLLAGDGSTVNLPISADIIEEFGVDSTTKGGAKTCLANACFLYDLQSNLILEADIGKTEKGETTMLIEQLKRNEYPNALILLDRGFGYLAILKFLYSRRLNFCIRLKTSQSSFSQKILSKDLDDFKVEWSPTSKEGATCISYGLDTEPIIVRATKVKLNTGEVEILISSLTDMTLVSSEEMKELYHMRWGIEEGIKKLKPKMKLEQFGCKKPRGIYQEFYAHIFNFNLITLIGNETQPLIDEQTKGRKYRYKYNWQNAFEYFRSEFINLFFKGKIKAVCENLFSKISKSIIAIIPGRQFERRKIPIKNRQCPCYK